jgi:HEAT repeat protein
MLKDPDPNVQTCAFHVLSRIDPAAIPRADLIRLLSSPQFDVVSQALNLLSGGQSPGFAGTALGSQRSASQSSPVAQLTSAEAAALTTNRFTMARILGLKILRQNADSQAIELTLPLLRDTNSLVRNRAFSLLKAVSGEDFSQSDPIQWDRWWATNKATFLR